MAGNKVNSKTKTKEDKNKANRNSSPGNEESEDLDFTLLRKPVHTSITGFAQARKVFDLATEEFKGLLTNECDILYECKVCRNIFRSLANFISHKRVYCKERFDTSVHGHFLRTLSVASEISRIKKLEELYNESLKEDLSIINDKEFDDRIPLTKDLTEIIEKLSIAKGKQTHRHENPEMVLQKIPKSNVAVYQNIKSNNENSTDLMKTQVKELNTIMSRENAILNSEGKVEAQISFPSKRNKDPESVIQISDDEDNEGDILKCKICDLQFSTQKTLKFHMKYKHLESRLVYPCPDCLEIFSTSWSVYRHLFKVHRKTAAQIRRLRESIQAKAFRMNNPPAFYEKRKNNAKNTTTQKITEEERLDQENQAWMDNMEGDGEVPRCGGCGRTFERRAALAAHTHTCQPRSRALARRPTDSRKIEIQIRKDYNKVPPPPPLTLPIKVADSSDNKQPNEDSPDKTKVSQEKEKGVVVDKKIKENIQNKSIENSLPKQTNEESQSNKNKTSDLKNTIKLPFAHQIELNNFNALSKQCLSDIEMDKLQCKKCDNKFTKVAALYEHMAEHYKWLRYACKLCNFKHYNFEKLPEHVKVVHKLKGDSDFYYSTVKAIDGAEALQLSECSKDTNDVNENSPDSRRPSRCSSDSSRVSDDSSSSSTRVEGTRKRKIKHNKIITKKKKDTIVIEDTDGLKDSEASNDTVDENDSSSNVKMFEENSSDVDEGEEKSTKKSDQKSVIAMSTRRPVRKRTNKKNEDFEYDLSNLLKMEAQGYRDSQIIITPKTIPTKKKSPMECQNNNENINKDFCGALAGLAKKAVAISAAHMKCSTFYPQSEARTSNLFLRPPLPKVARVEKISPKKDAPMQVSDISSPNKVSKQDDVNPTNSEKDVIAESNASEATPRQPEEDMTLSKPEIKEPNSINENIVSLANDFSEPTSIGKLNVPTVLPLKLRRQSLDLIKNPLIKKNITDFSKAGMKTKILVIKPINRNKDGGKSLNNPLKFQTIKLKDPIKSSASSKEKSSDHVRVVQVPTVDCAIKLPITNTCIVKNDLNLLTAAKSAGADLVYTATTSDKTSAQSISEISKNKEVSNHTSQTKPDVNTIEEISSTDNISRPEEHCLSKNYRTSPTAS